MTFMLTLQLIMRVPQSAAVVTCSRRGRSDAFRVYAVEVAWILSPSVRMTETCWGTSDAAACCLAHASTRPAKRAVADDELRCEGRRLITLKARTGIAAGVVGGSRGGGSDGENMGRDVGCPETLGRMAASNMLDRW